MIEYSNMSDMEINAAVTGIINDVENWELVTLESRAYFQLIGDGVLDTCHVRDYCGDISEAWPVIQEIMSIAMAISISETGVTTTNLGVNYGGVSINVDGELPRSAMVAYLMIKDIKR